ncbi:MAG TPA: efflux RND transporter periplasmic adaptor subunit, partial [Pirellulales bacterium]
MWTHSFDARPAAASAAEPHQSAAMRVETISPSAGGIIRKTVQPGSVHSFESAELFAKVSGFLKSQNVDIGSIVKRGELLAEIDVPELAQQLDRDKAEQRQAEADVALAQSQIETAIAERQAAEAYVTQAEASVKRSQADREYHEKQYRRIGDLSRLNSIEKRLVDEEFSQLQSAEAGELTARSAVVTAKAQVTTAAARIDRAESELLVSKAKLDVMRAEVAKTATLLSYTRITSPYDGLVTYRGFHRGAFIRAADQGGEEPLFRVDRTDLVRVVVLVPDRDVPFTQAGDRALVLLDALPGKPFKGKVARVAGTEDPLSRTMRVEVDVPNADGVIRNGMYGQVEIELEPASP